MDIVLVTGNQDKLKQFKEILVDWNIVNEKIDLEEIQSFDLKKIAQHKAKCAFEILKKPIMVEDTGFYIDDLKGLPGPFIRYFNDFLGGDCPIKLLKDSENRKAISKTCICYYDGKNFIFGEGELTGVVSYEPSKLEAFGFDCCFIGDGYDVPLTELDKEERYKISHRGKAICDIKNKLKSLV